MKTKKEKIEIPQIIKEILKKRGLLDNQDILNFLYPDDSLLYSSFLLDGMEEAVSLILENIKNKSKFLIFGDKDTDGITATAITYKTLSSISADVDYIITPADQDYDISIEIVDYALANNYKIIITVDCGCNSVAVMQKCLDANIKLLIFDHHKFNDETLEFIKSTDLKNKVIIVNPHKPTCNYPNKNLAGCGVAFKLGCALIEKMLSNKRYNKNKTREEIIATDFYKLYLNEMLPIVAIGTIADIMSLKDENRYITRLGYEIVKYAPPLYMEILKERLDLQTFNGDTLGFKIIPLLNAPRRMQKNVDIVKIFISKSKKEINKIIDELIELNSQRKIKSEDLIKNAIELAEKQLNTTNYKSVIVIVFENTDHGVTGLAANRLKDIFNLPVFIFIIDENGVAGGAARSPDNINIHQVLTEIISDTRITFGGHNCSLGIQMPAELIDDFRKKVNDYFADKDKSKTISIDDFFDYELQLSDFDLKLIDTLELFEPFGADNQRPLFLVKDLALEKINIIGEEKNHLNGIVKKINNLPSCNTRFVAWNASGYFEKLDSMKKMTAFCYLEKNQFFNNISLQMVIKKII